MGPAMAAESRITDLEVRLTHQEAALDELTRTVLDQAQQIASLQRDLEQLTEILRQLAPAAVGPESGETPPPHY
jgi:SlyX protein